MKLACLVALPAFGFSTLAAANVLQDQSFLCSHPEVDQKRVIELSYLSEDKAVPCEVKYTKGSDSKVLWSAQAEEGYCEAKLAAFVEKQTSWGWQCENIQ